MKPERQLGLLWGGVAVLVVALSPWASRFAAVLPACPFRSIVGLPCLSCGATRSAVALARLDIPGALAANPLAALAGMGLVGGGLVVGVLALLGTSVREPKWHLSVTTRWLLMAVLLINWVYLVGRVLSGSGARRVGIVFAVLMVAVLFWDLTREAEDQWSTKVLLTGIDLYQATVSPRMEDVGVRCRFQPTCSHYAEAVIREEGAMKGTWRAVGRIARCGPWTPAGTVDQP